MARSWRVSEVAGQLLKSVPPERPCFSFARMRRGVLGAFMTRFWKVSEAVGPLSRLTPPERSA